MAAIRVGGVPEHFNLPWHLALEARLFDHAGLDVEWVDMPGGTGQMTEALAAGDLHLAALLTEGVVTAIAKGNPASIVGLHTATPLRWGVHVASASQLATEDDLAAPRFAISRLGSGSHLMAFILAERLGISLDSESFVVTGGLDGAREALAGGEAEVFLWDRFMTSPFVESGEFRRLGEQLTPWPAFVLAARLDLIDEHDLATLLEVLASAHRTANSREDIPALVTDRYGLPAPEAENWWSVTQWAEDLALEDAVLADVRATLEGLGII